AVFQVKMTYFRQESVNMRKPKMDITEAVFSYENCIFRGSAPDRGRTCNLWLRRPTLYPVELRAQRERELATAPADFHRFSGVVLLLLALRARAQIVGDFGLQKECLRMRVCARSRAAGEELMN